MNTKIKKLLFHLSKNSRISTKNLAKELKTSQQSCSYLINQFKKKKKITESTTIVDAVKLGLTNILVGIDFLNYEYNTKRELLSELKKEPSIISIEENNIGVDLLVEYAAHNLSAFNKTNSDMLHKYKKELKIKFIMPVIVKHKFQKNYLMLKSDLKDIILCGDRDYVSLSENEKTVLHALVEQPDSSLLDIAKKAKITIKSVSNIKKKLEKKKIIRGYSCVYDNDKFEIMKHHILLKFTSDGLSKIDKFVEYAKVHKNIIELIKIIGEYQVMITIEELKSMHILKDIRTEFPIEDYFVIRSDKMYKKSYLPTEE